MYVLVKSVYAESYVMQEGVYAVFCGKSNFSPSSRTDYLILSGDCGPGTSSSLLSIVIDVSPWRLQTRDEMVWVPSGVCMNGK